MRIELRDNTASYWWVLVARNGQVCATSETYDTRSNALRAAKNMARRLKLTLRVK